MINWSDSDGFGNGEATADSESVGFDPYQDAEDARIIELLDLREKLAHASAVLQQVEELDRWIAQELESPQLLSPARAAYELVRQCIRLRSILSDSGEPWAVSVFPSTPGTATVALDAEEAGR